MAHANGTMTKSSKHSTKGYRVLGNECIWMKAGVVSHHICDNAFDCNTCAFDRALRRALDTHAPQKKTTDRSEWGSSLQKKYVGADRPCRHALTGRTDAPKICTLNYECYHCEFDQWLDECDLETDMQPPGCYQISGFQVAKGNFYHMGHSWVRCEHGGRARVGLDHFTTRVFGPMSSVELPPLGRRLENNRCGWSFRRNKHCAEVLAPVTGTVLAVNHKACAHPEIVYESPYHDGWLMILEPTELKSNLRQLYFGQETDRWMELEHRKLMGLMGLEYQNLQPTGGTVIDDVFGSLARVGWSQLAEAFLHTAAE